MKIRISFAVLLLVLPAFAQASLFDLLPQVLLRINSRMALITTRAAPESGAFTVHLSRQRKLMVEEIVERQSLASVGAPRTDYFIAPRFIGETGRDARSAYLGPMPRYERALATIQKEYPELVFRPHALAQTDEFGTVVENIDGLLIDGATLDPVVFLDILERLLVALR